MILNKINIGKGVELVISRREKSKNQTLGRFVVFDKDDCCIFSGVTLELPYINNEKNISSITKGIYKASKVVHTKFGKSIEVINVSNRSGIFIHSGNYKEQIRGCVLVGFGFRDLNGDGILDVYNSRVTLDNLYDSLSNKFDLLVL